VEDLPDVVLAPVAGPEPEARGRVGERDDHHEGKKEQLREARPGRALFSPLAEGPREADGQNGEEEGGDNRLDDGPGGLNPRSVAATSAAWAACLRRPVARRRFDDTLTTIDGASVRGGAPRMV